MHALLIAIPKGFFDLGNIAFEDQVFDVWRVQHELDCRDTFAGPRTNEPLRDDGAQIVAKIHVHLSMLLLREQIDDTVQCLGRVVRVKSRQDQVPRTGHIDGGLHRYTIANLTDLNEVRCGTHRTLQGPPV